MAFRLLRICSNEDSFEARLSELKKEFLIPRGYTPKIIDGQFDRIRNLPGTGHWLQAQLAAQDCEACQLC